MAEGFSKPGLFGGKDLSLAVLILVGVAIIAVAYLAWNNTAGDDDDSEKVYKVKVAALNDVHTAYPGRGTQFAIIVTNEGNVSDDIFLTTRFPDGIEIRYEDVVVRDKGPVLFEGGGLFHLDAGESGAVILTVDLRNVSAGTKQSINVQATSSNNKVKTDNIWLSIFVEDFPEDAVPIEQKDEVQVNYAGIRVSGQVFDTSMEVVAKNDDLDRKDGIAERTSFNTLKVYVGGKDPDQGDDYIQVVEGFWQGCVGMIPGESSVVRLEPERAYGAEENPSNELAGKWLIFEIEAVSIDGNAEDD